MNAVYLYAAVSVLAVSLMSLAGLGVMGLSSDRAKKLLPFLVSIAAGAMLGNAFLHLLPESIAALPQAQIEVVDPHAGHGHGHDHHGHDHDAHHDHDQDADAHKHDAAEGDDHGHAHNHAALPITALVLLGMGLFFAFDLWLHKLGHCCEHKVIKPIGWMVVVGDALENLMDGIIIGAAYLVSVPAGIATTVAVLVHEVPIELGDFGVLMHSGFSRRKALLVNLASAMAAFIGCGLVMALGVSFKAAVPYIAPLAAGAFIYMSASSLLPAIKEKSVHDSAIKHFACVLLGVGVMAALLLIPH